MDFQDKLSFKKNLAKIHAVSTKGVQPFSRVKSTSAVTDNGKLFLFGGFDEDDNIDSKVYILDIEKLEWQTHKHLVYREGHSALFVSYNNSVIVYGGVPEENINNPLGEVELLEYNLSTNQWSKPIPIEKSFHQTLPKQRSRHAACLSNDGNMMFISGGLHKDSLNLPYDDLYCYDIANKRWDGPRTFVSRFDHTIVHYNDKIWSFGGLNSDMAYSSEISWFDLKTNNTGSIIINDLPKLEGDHIFMQSGNNNILLDVLTPLWTYDNSIKPTIALYDLNKLRWQHVLSGSFKSLKGYRWRHTFIYNSKLYLLGYPLNDDTLDSAFDYKLTDIIEIHLSDLGIPSTINSELEIHDKITQDLKKSLLEEKFTDFEIIGIEGKKRSSINSKFLENPTPTQLNFPFLQNESNEDIFIKSKPLKVHKVILLSRWKYFEKLIDSGMSESQKNSLFIPEPVIWLRLLIEYLYTNKLETTDIDTLTGLLEISNLYELNGLRHLCIEAIYAQGFKTKNVLKIWKSAELSNEQLLAHNAINFCFHFWGKIVKTKQFSELSKEELVTLCQTVSQDSMILNNDSSQSNGKVVGNITDDEDNLQSENHEFVLNRYDTYNSANMITPISSAQRFNQISGFSNGFGSNRSTPNRTRIGVTEFSDEESNLVSNSIDIFGTRLTTPTPSIYGNPQSVMNSLGEHNNDEITTEGDETDFE